MELYLKNLIKQFKLATGIKSIDENSKEFIADFSEWIKDRQKMGNKYVYFLDYMGFRFADRDCAEVGKGEYDSIVKPFETTIITPSTSFKSVDSDRIIKGNMKVYESTPVLVTHRKGGNHIESIPNDIIHTFMTQNPISNISILGWENLHNSRNNDIIIGIYGDIHDKDIDAKKKTIDEIKAKLISTDYIEDYEKDDDRYFYVIGSSRIVKRRILTR